MPTTIHDPVNPSGGSALERGDFLWGRFGELSLRSPAQRHRHRWLMKELAYSRIPGQMWVADIGSGQGELLAAASDHFPDARLLGIDTSEVAIERGRKRCPRAAFFQGDVEVALPESWLGRTTHVICSEVLEHVDQPIPMLESVYRLLCEDGVLLITLPSGPITAFDRRIGHRRHYLPQEAMAMVRSAGFEVERVEMWGWPFFDFYRWAIGKRGNRFERDLAQDRNVVWRFFRSVAMETLNLLFFLNFSSRTVGRQIFLIARKTTR